MGGDRSPSAGAGAGRSRSARRDTALRAAASRRGHDVSAAGTPDATTARRRKLFAYIPLAIFLGLAFLFLLRLGAGDISRVPSALIGRPAPQTVLAPLPGLDRDGKPVPGIIPADFTG